MHGQTVTTLVRSSPLCHHTRDLKKGEEIAWAVAIMVIITAVMMPLMTSPARDRLGASSEANHGLGHDRA